MKVVAVTKNKQKAVNVVMNSVETSHFCWRISLRVMSFLQGGGGESRWYVATMTDSGCGVFGL